MNPDSSPEKTLESTGMTSEQRELLHAFAESLDDSVPELAQTLKDEAKRSAQARDDVSKVLQAGANASTVPAVKRQYETVDEAQQALFAHTLDTIARSIGELLQSGSGHAEAVPQAIRMTPGEAMAKLNAANLALDEVKMYRGLTLGTLNLAIVAYNDMCEKFLGYQIGSHDARRRVVRWLAKFGKALLAFVVPPAGTVLDGIDLAKEAKTQAQATPVHERVSDEEISATSEDARVALNELATSLLQNIQFVAENVGGMLDTYAEEYAALKALDSQLHAFFEMD